MPNDLHNFLHAANVQARPKLGSLFNYGALSNLTGFITSTDAKLAFELTGSMEQIGLVIVADLDQFTAGNEPEIDDQISYQGVTWALRSLGTDASAYVMGFKALTNAP